MTIESNDAIKAIAGMSAPQIILEWERVHGIRAPAIAPSLLARDLAHRVQVEAAGGIDKRHERRLRDLVVLADSKRAIAKPSVRGRNFCASGVVRLTG